MAYTWAIDSSDHDLSIKDGKIVWISGAAEVRQRIKIALWHYFGEYFLSADDGTPWYEEIMGTKGINARISNIIRKRILSVPGVIRITDLELSFNSRDRFLALNGSVVVQGGLNDQLDNVILDGIAVPV